MSTTNFYKKGTTDEMLKSLSLGCIHTEKHNDVTQTYNANVFCSQNGNSIPFTNASLSYNYGQGNVNLKGVISGNNRTGISTQAIVHNNNWNVGVGVNSKVGFIGHASMKVTDEYKIGLSQVGETTSLVSTLNSGRGHDFQCGVSSGGINFCFGFNM